MILTKVKEFERIDNFAEAWTQFDNCSMLIELSIKFCLISYHF